MPPDKGAVRRVKLETLVAVNQIADRTGAAVILGFQGILRHAPDLPFGQIGGVVFSISFQDAFQNDTLGPVGNDLGGRHHLNSVLFQSGFCSGRCRSDCGQTCPASKR